MLTILDDGTIKEWEQKLCEQAKPNAFDKMFPSEPYVPPPIWKRLWWKIKYPFQFRFVHKSRIDNEDW